VETIAMWLRPNLSRLAVRIPLIMLAVIFVAEAAIMAGLALASGDGRQRWREVFLDSSLLTLIVAPLLYGLIVRPLRVAADERARLLAHVFEIQDAERQQIARDLHDEIGQSFTALLVRLRLVEQSATIQDAREQAAELREQTGQVYDQVRNLARGLHPAVLDDLGLVEAVRRLAEDFEAAHGIETRLDVLSSFHERLERKVETTAYRIVQESLTNCAKHAHAARVSITVALDRRQLTVTIADNGRGFDAEKALRAPSTATFGLASMRERALLLKGSLTVRSRPLGGTTITLRVPSRA